MNSVGLRVKRGSLYYYIYYMQYLLDAYHLCLENHRHCHRRPPCPVIRKAFAVALLQQQGLVVRELGRVVVAAAVVVVLAELLAGPAVLQQPEQEAVVVLQVADISLQEYPSNSNAYNVYC